MVECSTESLTPQSDWTSVCLPAGHFTQVVWKDTKELGVGVATNGHTVFVVGQYRPRGNITNAGYFEKNVQQNH